MQLRLSVHRAVPGDTRNQGGNLSKLLRTMAPARLRLAGCRSNNRKTIFLAMRFTAILLTVACMQATAGHSQKITLRETNAPIQKIFREIWKQSGFQFVYTDKILEGAKPVTIHVKDEPLDVVLQRCFEQQPFTFSITDGAIVVKEKPATPMTQSLPEPPLINVHGRIVNEKGEPVAGATVTVKGTRNATATDDNGEFVLISLDKNAVLVISGVNIETKEIKVGGKTNITLEVKTKASSLDAVQVIAYGTTTKRLSTGNIGTLQEESISRQPITNSLQALSGQISGLQVIQTNGLPGAPIRIQIRGRNSISSDNFPLYIIDGVPFPSVPIERSGGPNSVPGEFGSPMNNINPNDIQSISILKDADATSIYGSRAANGVILITTKKGKQGATKLDVRISSGFGKLAVEPKLLNTKEYLELRKDAFTNSGINPTQTNAPDLLLWSQTEDFNWLDWYMGNTMHQTDANLSISGGNDQMTFIVSGNHHIESTILASNGKYSRNNVHMRITYSSKDKKFNMQSDAYYSASKNILNGAGANVRGISQMPPNYPIYDSNGNYYWTAAKTNYLAQLNIENRTNIENIIGNLNLSYQIFPKLFTKINIGFNKLASQNKVLNPSIARNPSTNPLGISSNTTNTNQSFIFEPQLEYIDATPKGKLNILIGGNLQQSSTNGTGFSTNNYPNDLLLESANFGTPQSTSSNSSEYKYVSAFGRATYIYENKYIANGTVRRDGSSRFGPGKQFGTFYSIGGAWLFGEEVAIKRKLNFLSYGKIRGSYGTTGNDGIGDYGYLSLYSSTGNYGTANSIIASQIENPNFRWEVNKKLEFGLDLGLLEDRILFSTSWYQNRSGNQLVQYALPTTTGFSGYIANFPAVVENKGFEFELSTKNKADKKLRWSASINLNFPSNKLIQFPGLESSTYANSLVLGRSLDIVQLLQFKGIDPDNGLSIVEDINKDGQYTQRSSYNGQNGDYIIAGKTDPDFFGGLTNTLNIKGFELDVLIQFVKQMGYNNRGTTSVVGRTFNTYADNLKYWKSPGDIVDIPKPFAAANPSITNYGNSTATFTDASFIRLKNVSLNYFFPSPLLQKMKISSLKIFVQGQNLITLTKFLGLDPENAGSPTPTIPSLKMISFGIHCTL